MHNQIKIISPQAPRRHKPAFSWILAASAVILFAVGAFAAFQGAITRQAMAKQTNAATQPASAPAGGPVSQEQPAEDAPPDTAGYSVAADKPRLLTIPKLAVVSRVVPLGVDHQNTILTPQNIFDTGWYTGSATLGLPNTATLLVGHNRGPTKEGVFSKLQKLVVGDSFTVERGDGRVFTYRVVLVEAVDLMQVNMARVLSPAVPDQSGLNIMTCTGKYNAAQKTYDKRLVVYATLAD